MILTYYITMGGMQNIAVIHKRDHSHHVKIYKDDLDYVGQWYAWTDFFQGDTPAESELQMLELTYGIDFRPALKLLEESVS